MITEQKPADNRKLRLLANELLFTSSGATVGAIGAAIVSSGIVFPAVGSVIGGIVGFAVIKIIREVQIRKMEDREDWEHACAVSESIKEHGTISWGDIKRELEEDGLKEKAKPIKKEDIGDWLRSLLD